MKIWEINMRKNAQIKIFPPFTCVGFKGRARAQWKGGDFKFKRKKLKRQL